MYDSSATTGRPALAAAAAAARRASACHHYPLTSPLPLSLSLSVSLLLCVVGVRAGTVKVQRCLIDHRLHTTHTHTQSVLAVSHSPDAAVRACIHTYDWLTTVEHARPARPHRPALTLPHVRPLRALVSCTSTCDRRTGHDRNDVTRGRARLAVTSQTSWILARLCR